MKTTTYAGIDYSGHTGVNRDSETGIRYGVISQHSIQPDAMSDIWDKSEDLSHKEAVATLKGELERTVSNYIRKADLAEIVDELWAVVEDKFNNGYEDGGEHDWRHESDGMILINCLQSDVMVLKSKFFTYAQFCSPCVLGACNLDSPLSVEPLTEKVRESNRCYCLGHDYFDNGIAPYPVYFVETGELVMPQPQ